VRVRGHSPTFYLFVATGLVVFILAYPLLSPILLSFILIVLITLAANPVVLRLRQLTGGRRLATAVITLTFIATIALTVWAFLTPIKASTTRLVQRLPEYWEQVQRPLLRLEKQAALSEARLNEEVTTEVVEGAAAKGEHEQAQRALNGTGQGGSSPGSLRSGLLGMAQGAAGGFKSFAYSAAEMLVVLVTVFFGVVFTLMNPRPIFTAIFSLVHEPHHERALRVMQRIAEFVPQWALSTMLGMLTIGSLVFLLMWPIFGFMDALILGVIAGVLESVPYLGPTLSAVPGLLLALGKGGMTPVWVLLAYVAVQALENNVILPFIMAKGMRLHPVSVIFSMLLCVAAFGVLGVIIAPPMAAILGILHDELYRQRYLPGVSQDELENLARKAMRERQ
jgi:predicted PurR-regulated permease PerM